MDYGMPSFRKTKGDKKAKRKYRVYKKGGRSRGDKLEDRNLGSKR